MSKATFDTDLGAVDLSNFPTVIAKPIAGTPAPEPQPVPAKKSCVSNCESNWTATGIQWQDLCSVCYAKFVD